MSDGTAYDDRVLLRSRRQYSKDEVLGAFVKKIDELEAKLAKRETEKDKTITKLTTEVNDLRQKYLVGQEQKEINREARLAVRKSELYQNQKELLDRCRKERRSYREKYYNMIAKCNALEQKLKDHGVQEV